MPVARAINTAPLVAMNGNIIDGVGLDRQSGLIHRIEPQLRACLPMHPPTEHEAREALSWLLDVWLVDVSADTTGKLLVLMLCLSMIERVLLKERPAWFVTAGHRGGGKTTLVLMLTVAVFGRLAAAAAWSDKEEERRKALFSYLRQGVAVLVWDLMTPLICQTGPKTSANSGCSCSVREKRCISGRNLASGIVGIRS